ERLASSLIADCTAMTATGHHLQPSSVSIPRHRDRMRGFLVAAAVHHDRLTGRLGTRRGVAFGLTVATEIARVVVLLAAGTGIAKLADVDAIDAIVAAMAGAHQVVGDIGASLGAAIAAVDGAQHADRRRAVGRIGVLVALILLRADLDGAAGAGQRYVDLRPD